MAKDEKAHINIPKGPEAGKDAPVQPQNSYYGNKQAYTNPNTVNNGRYNSGMFTQNNMPNPQNRTMYPGTQNGFSGQYPQGEYQPNHPQGNFQNRANRTFYSQNNVGVGGNYAAQNNSVGRTYYQTQNNTGAHVGYSPQRNASSGANHPAQNNAGAHSGYGAQASVNSLGGQGGYRAPNPNRGQARHQSTNYQATNPATSQNLQNPSNSGFDKLASGNGYGSYNSFNPNDSFSPAPTLSNANADHGGAYRQQSNPGETSQFSQPYAKHSDSDQNAHAPHSQKKRKPKSRSSALAPILTCIIAIAAMFGLAFLLREYVFQAYEIPSGSMEETIMTGDMVFAEKVSHFIAPPQRGDIITFEDPEVEGRVLIKRCIAVGGQTVDIKNNKFIVDGIEIDEPYTNGKPTKTLNRSKITFPYTIPQGEIWVMGDNRTNSQDSRYYGSIPVSSVIGRALLVYWPTSDAKVL